MLFINTINHPTKRRRKSCKKARLRLLSGKKDFVCCCCNDTFPAEMATVEHKVPSIVLRSGKHPIPTNDSMLDLACAKCNQGRLSRIPDALARIWNSRNYEQIKQNSRFICDLVRKSNA